MKKRNGENMEEIKRESKKEGNERKKKEETEWTKKGRNKERLN